MITEIAKKINFPEEAIEYFKEKHDALMARPELYSELYRAMDEFYMKGDRSFIEILDKVAAEADIPNYSVHMIFLLLAARPLRYIYRQQGISEDIYYETLTDLKCKLMECKNVQGCWGTFVGWWYPDMFRCKIVKLGRLEYERLAFPHDDYKGFLKKGDKVFNCHIPSSGPVTKESVIESLKIAYAFFSDELKDGILPVYCSSWMLYPGHKELYPEGSNLRNFYELFDIFAEVEDKSNHNFWRLFNVDYSPETFEAAPENTTLQRNIKNYIRSGKNMGTGKGVLLFDGEKIL